MELDRKNGNNYWKEAEATEMKQLLEYNTFIDKGTQVCTYIQSSEFPLSYGL
jgi:hypothetical protein